MLKMKVSRISFKQPYHIYDFGFFQVKLKSQKTPAKLSHVKWETKLSKKQNCFWDKLNSDKNAIDKCIYIGVLKLLTLFNLILL